MSIQTITPETSIYLGRGLGTMTRGEATALVERFGGKVAATPDEADMFVFGRTLPKRSPNCEMICESDFLRMARRTEDAQISVLTSAHTTATAAAQRASEIYCSAIARGADPIELASAFEADERAMADLCAATQRLVGALAVRRN